MGSNGREDGFLVLTDDASVMLKRVASNREEWERAKKEAKFLHTVKDLSEVPIILDPKLVPKYFTEKNFRQEIKPVRMEKRKTVLDDTFTQGLQVSKKTDMESLDDKLASVRTKMVEYRNMTENLVGGHPSHRDAIVENMEVKYEELDASIAEINCVVEQSKQEGMQEKRHLETQLNSSNRIRKGLENEVAALREAMEQKELEHKGAMAGMKTALETAGEEQVKRHLEERTEALKSEFAQWAEQKTSELNSLNEDLKESLEKNYNLRTELEESQAKVRELDATMRSCRKIKKEARELADKATSPASSSTQTTSGKKGRPTKKIARRLFDSDSCS